MLFLSPVYLRSQSFQGYRSSNYTGIHGLFFNPANIADNRYKWDVNIFSIDGFAGNDQQGLNFGDVIDANFNFDTLKATLLRSTGPGLSALGRMDLLGPSVMYDLKGKISFALSTRARVFSNAREIDGRLVSAVIDGSEKSADYPFVFNMGSALTHSVSWDEIGFSAAKAFSIRSGRHFLKAGLSLKYLAGTADTYLKLEQFSGTTGYNNPRGTYITNTTGRLEMHTSSNNFVGFTFGDLVSFSGNGFSTDVGIIYEFRPWTDYSTYADDRFANKYKLKAGIALLDFGKLKFRNNTNQNAIYDVNVSAEQQYNLRRFRTRSVKDYKQFFDISPYFTTIVDNSNPYKVTLPAVIQADVDYHIKDEYYVSASGQFDLNSSDNLNLFAFNSYSLVPRYENEKFSFIVPVNYNEVSKFNAGFSFRYRYLFVGSGSLFTAIFGSKQADFHIGFHYGFDYKKKPRLDRDKDGMYDLIDACPLDSGLLKYGGCPISDRDFDGVPDAADSCISQAGLAKYHGCPIPDRDKDGVADEVDQCPDSAGLKENNGCPPVMEKAPEPVTELPPKEKDTLIVYFKSASASLSQEAKMDLLSDLRKLKAQSPNAKFNVDGYADNTGSVAINNKYSRLRAEHVAGLLKQAGIKQSRITVRWFGIYYPRCENDTESGRACNRRVTIKRKE
jgi:outer membrane protein OmpA-like peptidoglycan-associated protein